MIDTVHFTLHNFSNYKNMFAFLSENYKRKNAWSQVYYNPETGQKINEIPMIKGVIFHDSTNILPLSTWQGQHVGSFHYKVMLKSDFSRDTCTFNVSIPKLVYGTNIMQFLYEPKPLDAQNLYFKFLQFFREFFLLYFNEDVSLFDVEMKRIDFCYNQFFPSKKDALSYLDSIKKNSVKNARSSGNTGISYDTTAFYQTDDYSFKVYHKGTEFKKHDYKELVKNNPRNYPLQFFLDESDKILRYEMTMRIPYFKEVFYQKFFPFRSGKYNENKAFIHDVHHVFLSKMMRYGVPFDIIDKWRLNSLNFFLQSQFDVTDDIELLLSSSSVTFNMNFFIELIKLFWAKVEQYQVGEVSSYLDVYEKIKKKNEVAARRKKLSMKESENSVARLLFPIILSQYESLDNLKKFIPKSTYYRIRKEIIQLGFNPSKNENTIVYCRPQIKDYTYYFLNFSNFHT